MESTSSFGYWIRRQRKALDLTQQVLAERVGCSVAAIKKIESDERRPSRQIAERLADALGVPANQREMFLEVARGIRPIDQLLLAHEPIVPASKEIPSLPSGTVTFLFTDIEGSTLLSQIQPEAMKHALARHHTILRTAIESNNGYVFQIVGDSFSAAFRNALDGLNAALTGQRGLRDEPWGETGPIHVRMGLHTGMAEITEDTTGMPYSSFSTMAFTQRIMSAAHGEQTLLSQITHDLVLEQLPSDVTLLDMGEHRLKDLLHSIHLYQVTAPDLPPDFPALRTLSTFRNNLPAQLTSFIGRDHEMAEVKQLLSNTRLLTFTGPGGTGKTRLALQLAAEVLEEYANGVWLVELAPLADPTLVAQTIASTLDVHEQPGRSMLDALTDYVRAKTMLLILDNCEHLVEACALLANTLLRAAPHLKILASSREALGIAGEIAYRVPSLPLPDMHVVSLDALAQNDCVRLFVDRASASYSPFRLKEMNAPAVANICRRLDGIPLAIELAAARTKVFSSEEIAARLDDRFRLLTGGSRTALERHQTLFALIEWSHNLLSEAERVFLRRLSVFAGGWSFQAVEAVCSQGIDEQTLDLLTHLVDKSLVIVEEQEGEVRYHFLETIRQYARDRLFESGEAEQVRDRHVVFFIQFAEGAEPKLRSAEQIEWLERMEIEHDNLRTALAWSLENRKSDRALQLAGALSYFWEIHGYWSEGQKWLNDALALSERQQSERVAAGEVHSPSRAETARHAKALYWAGRLPAGPMLLEMHASRIMVEESLRSWRELGDKWWMAAALEYVGYLLFFEGDFQTARARLEEGVALAREVGDPWLLAVCLEGLGECLMLIDVAAAHKVIEEGVPLARSVGDKSVLSHALGSLVSLYFAEGNLTAAARVGEERLAEARAIGNVLNVMLSLFKLIGTSCLQGDLVKAKDYCFQALASARETGTPQWHLLITTSFGLVASFSGQPERAVRLTAAGVTLLTQMGLKVNLGAEIDPGFKALQQAQEKAKSQLGPEAFQAAWAEGQQMTIEQALALATEDKDSQNPNGEVVKT